MTWRIGARGRLALGALGVALAALVTRFHNVGGIYLDGVTILFGTDPYYHLRRIELALGNGLHIPQFDPYVNFPTGALIDWPPGFDVAMALAYLAVSPFLPDDVGLVAVLAAVIPFVGAAVAVGVFAFGCRLYGLRAGLWAGLAFALTASAIDYGTVGRVDHHVAEPLCLLVLLFVYDWSARSERAMFSACILGAVAALIPGIWPGGIVFSGPVVVALLVDGYTRPDAWKRGGVAFLTAAAFAGVLAFSSEWGRDASFAYYALSLFQPLVFLAGAAVLTLPRLLSPRWSVVGAMALIALALALEPTRSSIARGIAYLFTSESQINTVLESTPPLEMGLAYTVMWMTPWVVALPAIAWFGFRFGDTPGKQAVAWALVLTAVLAFLQLRFAPLLAVPMSLLLGAGLDRVVRHWQGGWRVSAAATAAFVASLWPSMAPSLAYEPVVVPQLVQSLDGLIWLRNVPRPTSSYLEPWERPEYGVLSAWGWGHWVTAIAQKPNIANPLGQSDTNLAGIANAARVLLATSEAEGAAMAEALGARFLLLTPLVQGLEGMVAQLGKEMGDYASIGADGAHSVEPAFFDTLHSTLYLPQDTVPDSERFRLVYEGTTKQMFLEVERPYVKIFQVVPGAVLAGRCTAPQVEFELVVHTNTGRALPYRRVLATSPDGSFELAVPYATEPIRHGTSGGAPATLVCGGRSARVSIPHAAVEHGKRIEVAFDDAPVPPPPAP